MATTTTTTTTTTQIDGGASRNTTGLTDSTHSSSTSSSASKYDLCEDDTTPILLYKYRGGLQTSSQKDLCAWLDKDETFRVTKKPIPRYASYIEVKRHDLFLPAEQLEFCHTTPNYDSNLASVRLPLTAYWSRLLLGRYEKLYIVSPESSPNASVAGEGDDSGRGSPVTTTWGQDSIEDVHIGAAGYAR